jgi:hypothetical protein
MATSALPVIDPDVKFVGVSKLRDMNATKLRESQSVTYVLQENHQPLAVLLSYDRYLLIQQQLASVMSAVELLSDSNESQGVIAGVREMTEGRTRPFSEIKDELRNRYGVISKAQTK